MVYKLHKRLIRIMLNDYTNDFNELLQTNNKLCNNHRNIQTLLSIKVSISKKRINYDNLRNF